MKAWSIVLFFVCLNLAGYILAALSSEALGVLPATDQSLMPYQSIDDLKAQFALDIIVGVIGGVGVAGLIGIMLKQYTFGVLAGAIWVFGVLFTVGQWLLAGIDIAMRVLLAGTGLAFLADVIYVGILVAFFALLAETLSSKPLT